MKQRKITIFGVIIAILVYGIICSYVPEAGFLILLTPGIIAAVIAYLLIRILIKAYKYYSNKNKP